MKSETGNGSLFNQGSISREGKETTKTDIGMSVHVITRSASCGHRQPLTSHEEAKLVINTVINTAINMVINMAINMVINMVINLVQNPQETRGHTVVILIAL